MPPGTVGPGAEGNIYLRGIYSCPGLNEPREHWHAVTAARRSGDMSSWPQQGMQVATPACFIGEQVQLHN
jgi:hypothetical protein